jgi:CDP-glucose 4,6-dehydratase
VEDLGLNASFWKGKTVLVTGHTGFKGSWLSLWLAAMGAKVVGYALPPPTSPSLFELANVARDISAIEGDVRDADYLQSVVSQHQPDIVLHLAAQALVRPSYQDPVATYASNVMGTVHLLEAIRKTDSVRAVVIVTSDKCYENREWLWPYRENEAMGGYDPYSSSKGCAELVTAAYRNSFFSKQGPYIASARAGNVIGGGDWALDRLIPDAANAMLENRALTIRNPAAVRPWQHVLEPLHGYLLLAQKLFEQGSQFAQAWNFGPAVEEAKPVSWVVEQFGAAWGKHIDCHIEQQQQPHEAGLLMLDSSKARNLLGWQPRLDITQALQWTADWYRSYGTQQSMREYTEQQISTYQNLRAG